MKTVFTNYDFNNIDIINNVHYQIAYEAFFSRNEKVTEIVKNTPKVTKEQLIQEAKPIDVIVSYPIWSKLKLLHKISYFLNSRVQASSFSSTKLVGGTMRQKIVIGYGVYLNDTSFNKIPLNDYVENYGGIILLRYHNPVSENTKKRILTTFESFYSQKIPYSLKQLLASVKAHVLNSFKQSDDTNDITKYLKDGLICSTILYKIFKLYNLKILSNYDSNSIWPADLLVSESFDKVCCYFADGEYND